MGLETVREARGSMGMGKIVLRWAGLLACGWLFSAPVAAGLSPHSARPLDDRATRHVLNELQKELRSGSKWTRREAVRDLANLATESAWELVLGALGDEAGEVADTAQLLLAGVSEVAWVERFFGREGLGNRDRWVVRRVAELLGRLSVPIADEELAQALGSKDADVRRMLLFSIERLARAERLGARMSCAGESSAWPRRIATSGFV